MKSGDVLFYVPGGKRGSECKYIRSGHGYYEILLDGKELMVRSHDLYLPNGQQLKKTPRRGVIKPIPVSPQVKSIKYNGLQFDLLKYPANYKIRHAKGFFYIRKRDGLFVGPSYLYNNSMAYLNEQELRNAAKILVSLF